MATDQPVDKVLRSGKSSEDPVKDALDKVFQSTSVGPLTTAIGDTFYGLNHRQMPNPVPINKDHFGLTFFTRPLMNMTTENLRMVRQMMPLLTTESASIPRIIRCTLDRDLVTTESLSSPFVDNQQAFIPILTDTLLSMSGWPDVTVPTFTSKEGMYKESYSLVDGLSLNYTTYDIQASFRNVPGDPITLLLLVWLHYMSNVYQGNLVPRPNFIIENEIDYQTRIYRLILDSTKTKVQKIAACGAAFPTAVPIGGAFNFEADRPLNNSNDQITVPFRCMGAMYQDDILIKEFNETVVFFNNSMLDGYRETHFQLIPNDILILFNHRGYPRINPDTYELEWWIDKNTFNQVLS